jgi:uncharacterized membrane-anchored protein
MLVVSGHAGMLHRRTEHDRMHPMDAQYRKMMLWVGAALIVSIVAALLIVEWTMKWFTE